MYINRVSLFSSALLIGMNALFLSLPSSATEGASLFQQHCQHCHQTAKDFKAAPDQVSGILKNGSVRQHRFSLDDNTIQLIIHYIEQQKS